MNQVIKKSLLHKIRTKALVRSLTPFYFFGSCCRDDILLSLGQLGDCGIDLESPVYNPWQADLLIVAGPVNFKQIELLQRTYEEMLEPRFVIGLGACALTGGGFNPGIVSRNISAVIPVDVMVPGCPPSLEDLQEAFYRLKTKILNGEPQ